jgi:hypothetical protein
VLEAAEGSPAGVRRAPRPRVALGVRRCGLRAQGKLGPDLEVPQLWGARVDLQPRLGEADEGGRRGTVQNHPL